MYKQDLSKLFLTLDGTFLPPAVALYAVCNALLVNGQVTTMFFMNMVQGNKILPEFIQLFLRLVRDIVACFTMCVVEGIYWADLSLKKHVEDQPFPYSFMPTERVFGKDDCEGRATQIQHMKQLFIQIWKCVEHVGHMRVLEIIMGMSSTQACLHMEKNELGKLLDCCCVLGKLFNLGYLDVETTVGEVHFGSLAEGVKVEVVGHSFAMVIYKETPEQCYDVCIIETTGWERRYLPTWDRPLNSTEIKIMNSIHSVIKQYAGHDHFCICSIMSEKMENDIYQNVLLGRDSIYFTQKLHSYKTKGGHHKIPPQFGAHVDSIRRSLVFYPEKNAAKPTAEIIRLTTREFIQELCAHAPSSCTTTTTTSSSSTDAKPRLWPPTADAEDILAEFDIIQV